MRLAGVEAVRSERKKAHILHCVSIADTPKGKKAFVIQVFKSGFLKYGLTNWEITNSKL